jgi:spore germination protein KA
MDIMKLLNKNKEKLEKKKSEYNEKKLNSKNLKEIFGNSGDIKFRDILINNKEDMKVTLIYVDGLVNSSYISDYVLKPII